MNFGQLQAYLEQHKQVVLGVGAAGVVGVALLQRRKKTGGAAAPSASSSRQPAGTIPAAAVVPSQQTSSTYDSSAYDVYNALTGQLGQLSEQIRQTGSASGVDQAPAPIASAMFAPTYNGNYLRYLDSDIQEVQSDGSLFHFTPEQWAEAVKRGGNFIQTDAYSAPTKFGSEANTRAKWS